MGRLQRLVRRDELGRYNLEASESAILEGVASERGFIPQPAFSLDLRVRRHDQLAIPKS